MFTKIAFWLLVAAIAIGGYLLAANHFNIFPFGGTGHGDGEGVIPAFQIIDEVDVTIEPPSFIIEIREDRIIYNNVEVTLDDLDEILRRYANVADTWELHDALHASRAVYEEVRELLRTHDILFRER